MRRRSDNFGAARWPESRFAVASRSAAGPRAIRMSRYKTRALDSTDVVRSPQLRRLNKLPAAAAAELRNPSLGAFSAFSAFHPSHGSYRPARLSHANSFISNSQCSSSSSSSSSTVTVHGNGSSSKTRPHQSRAPAGLCQRTGSVCA